MTTSFLDQFDAGGTAAELDRGVRGGPLLAAAPNRLADALCNETISGFGTNGPFSACLFPLLDALRWRGTPRDLTEALPHFADTLELTDMLNVLASLGYPCRGIRVRRGNVEPRLLPALLVRPDGEPLVVIAASEDGWRVWCPIEGRERELAQVELDGVLYARAQAGSNDDNDNQLRAQDWMDALVRRFRGTTWQLIAIAALLNGFVIITSFYMMAIYDKVLPTHNGMTLLLLMVGVGAILVVDAALRQIRARIIAHVSARVRTVVATATFRQMMALPTTAIESTSVGNQVAKLREFDSICELFAGPVVNVVLELPFVLIFVFVIWWLAGPIVWVPLIMIALYGVVGAMLHPSLKREVKKSSRARAERSQFLLDLFTNFAAVKQLSLEKRWLDRFSQIASDTAYSHYQVTRLTQLLQTLAQAIMVGAGIGAVAWSAVRVVDGDMTIGAMIAVMTLIWRLLSPMQSLFLALTRIEQAKLSTRQLSQLMRLPTEIGHAVPTRRVKRNIVGAVAFDRVSFRYSNVNDPALMGISFAVKAGDLVAVTGGNGSGKTTLLTLMLALNRPQAGAILIDGVDIRQMEPIELRHAIGYVPQETALFHGTVAQNLRLGNPLASMADLEKACAEIGILDAIRALPLGFDTHLGENSRGRYSAGLRQGLAIARALAKHSRILLLDESAQMLDPASSLAFTRLLEDLKGKVTVFLVTHRPSHMALADHIATLNRGQLAAFGKPEKIIRGFGDSAKTKGNVA
jgi:ATP-binding cassette subfamily C protein/ATP-binding cassette subfamily C protein LapB